MCMPEHRRESWIEDILIPGRRIDDALYLLCLSYLVFMYYGFGLFYLHLYYVLDVLKTKVYVMYELGMFVWFVLYYVTDLDFGFVDFQVFIMVTIELGVYIITIYYAMYLSNFFIFFFCIIIIYG